MSIAVFGTGLVLSHDVQTPPDLAPLKDLLPGLPLRRIPHLQRVALLAAARALDNAGWRNPDSVTDMALVVGSAYGCPQTSMDFMDSILDNGPQLSSPTAFSHSVNNVHTGILSLYLGIRGPCMNVTQFGQSFVGAVQAANAMLTAGRTRRVLLGMVEGIDKRFARCCPDVPETGEGAVFFCVGEGNGGQPLLPAVVPATTALASAVATLEAIHA